MSTSHGATVVTAVKKPATTTTGSRGAEVERRQAYRQFQPMQPPGMPPYPLPPGFPTSAVAHPEPAYHLPPIPVRKDESETVMDNSNELLWREIRKQGEIYSPRFDHSTIRRGDQVFLFAGSTANFYTINEFLNDLFVFDTISGLWSRMIPRSTSPCPRAGQTMVMHKNKRLHVFGGLSQTGPLDDLWSYDFKHNIWACRRPGGLTPPPRSHHSACTWGDYMLVFGGTEADEEGEVWALEMNTRIWTRPEVALGPRPAKRQGHEAVVVDGSMFVFAGKHLSGPNAGDTSNDLWVLDLKTPVFTWTQLTPGGTPPLPRHGAASVKIGSRWVIQGGRTRVEDDVVSQTDDAMAFHFASRSWQPLPESLVPFCQASRWGHKLNLIRTRTGGHCILLTGGVTLCRLPLH